MGRPLWFVAGAGVGVYAAARARRLADSLTADGLRERARSARLGARLFAEQLGLVPHGRPELGAGAAPAPGTRPDARPAPRPDPRRDD